MLVVRELHCDISICVCNVPWLDPPAPTLHHHSRSSPAPLFLEQFHCSVFMQVYAVHWPSSPSFTLFIHPPHPLTEFVLPSCPSLFEVYIHCSKGFCHGISLFISGPFPSNPLCGCVCCRVFLHLISRKTGRNPWSRLVTQHRNYLLSK
jgi:hypothetical protein